MQFESTAGGTLRTVRDGLRAWIATLIRFRPGGSQVTDRAGRVQQVVWLVAALAVAVAAALGWAFTFVSSNNVWTVAGGIAAIGALFFALTATMFAVAAYRDSTETPELRFSVLLCNDATPAANNDNTFRWIVKMGLVNDGPVAARFIAVRVTLVGAEFTTDVPGWPIDPADRHIVQWDGGTNAIIHPRWPKNVSALDMWVVAPEDADTFTAKFEAIADRAEPITEPRTVKLIRA